jgi:uncharacterized protein YbjT (DUF2867 family)
MTILVLNANGKVGHEVATQLLAKGAKVRIGARDVAKAKAAFAGADIVHVDYTKPESLDVAMAGVMAVFTATPFELLPQPELDVVTAAKKAGVKRIVKLSGIGAEKGTPHGDVDAAIKDSGLEFTFLRPNFFMQNYTTMSAAGIKTQGAFYEPADEGKSSFIDTRDIAAVAVKALTEAGHNGKDYTLTGGEALSRKDVAEIISKVTGKPVNFVNVDDAALRQAMAQAPKQLTDFMSYLFGVVRAGYTAGVSPDVETVLGRKPTTFAQFAKDHAGAWKA